MSRCHIGCARSPRPWEAAGELPFPLLGQKVFCKIPLKQQAWAERTWLLPSWHYPLHAAPHGAPGSCSTGLQLPRSCVSMLCLLICCQPSMTSAYPGRHPALFHSKVPAMASPPPLQSPPCRCPGAWSSDCSNHLLIWGHPASWKRLISTEGNCLLNP